MGVGAMTGRLDLDPGLESVPPRSPADEKERRGRTRGPTQRVRPGDVVPRTAPTGGSRGRRPGARLAHEEGREVDPVVLAGSRTFGADGRDRRGHPAAPDVRTRGRRRPGKVGAPRALRSWTTRSPARRSTGPRRGPMRWLWSWPARRSVWARVGSEQPRPLSWSSRMRSRGASNNALELTIRHRIWLRTTVGAGPADRPVQVSCRAARRASLCAAITFPTVYHERPPGALPPEEVTCTVPSRNSRLVR